MGEMGEAVVITRLEIRKPNFEDGKTEMPKMRGSSVTNLGRGSPR